VGFYQRETYTKKGGDPKKGGSSTGKMGKSLNALGGEKKEKGGKKKKSCSNKRKKNLENPNRGRGAWFRLLSQGKSPRLNPTTELHLWSGEKPEEGVN